MGKFRGKIVGGLLGFAVGGPFGAVLGFIAGHVHDQTHDSDQGLWRSIAGATDEFAGNRQQSVFTMGVIVLGAKMAKADGRVTREEIEAFKRVFRVPPEQVDHVGRLFDRAARDPSGFEPFAMQLAQTFRGHPEVLEQVLGGLFMIAASDSKGLSPSELRFLKRVAVIFGFNDAFFALVAARAGVLLPDREKPRDQSYIILGVKETASIEEIKATYRSLIRTHHPDKLVAEGMAPEFVAAATEKMKRINAAYETVCRSKGIK